MELGSGPGGPPAADAFLVAVATRFGPILRAPDFDAARPKLAAGALVPSRVFDDPSLWTAREGEWRQLDLHGERVGEWYRLGVRASAPPLTEVGDYRGRLRLKRLEKGRFEWSMLEELAVGPVGTDELSRALTSLLRSADVMTAAEARVRAREAFPRATAAFSRLVHLETLELSQSPRRPGLVGLRIRPDGIRGIAPRYAAFLDEYMAPVKASLTVADVTGASWWTTSLAEGLWSIGLRVRDGRLAPLEGPPDRRLPQRLRASFSYSTRAGILTVGVERSGCRRGAHPLSARGGLRRPLRRGTRLAAAISPGAAHQRLPAFSVRRSGLRVRLLAPRADRRADPDRPRVARARVRESWVVRWLGGLSDRAFIDFRKGAEAEADRFNRECLYALRDDVVALLNLG